MHKVFDGFGEGVAASYQNPSPFARGKDNGFRASLRPDIILRKH
jgi:hypothetical protein